jgi:hypothetical protein
MLQEFMILRVQPFVDASLLRHLSRKSKAQQDWVTQQLRRQIEAGSIGPPFTLAYIDLIDALLSVNFHEQPTAEEMLAHQYFVSMPNDLKKIPILGLGLGCEDYVASDCTIEQCVLRVRWMQGRLRMTHKLLAVNLLAVDSAH